MRHMARGAANIIERAGVLVTYRKLNATSTYSTTTGKMTASETDYSVRVGVRSYSPREITGLVNAGDREVRLRGIDLPFTPAEGDKIQIGTQWVMVRSINTLYAGDDQAMHIMQVSGA